MRSRRMSLRSQSVAGARPAPRPPLGAEAVRAHLAMMLFAACISVSFPLGHRAAPHIAPEALTLARFALASVVMALLAAGRARAEHFRAAWRFPVLGGLLALYFVLMFEALRLTDAVSTAAVFTLIPAMSAVFGWLLLRQVTTPRMAVALALGSAGAVWVIFRGDWARLMALDLGAGEAIFLVGCAAHAFYAPLVRRLNRGEPVIVFTLGTLLGGLVPLALWAWPSAAGTDWGALPPVVWAAVAYLGLVATAGTFFLLQYATMRIKAAQVMAYGFLTPVFVVVWEGLLTGDWVSLPVWLGVAAIVGALLLLLRG